MYNRSWMSWMTWKQVLSGWKNLWSRLTLYFVCIFVLQMSWTSLSWASVRFFTQQKASQPALLKKWSYIGMFLSSFSSEDGTATSSSKRFSSSWRAWGMSESARSASSKLESIVMTFCFDWLHFCKRRSASCRTTLSYAELFNVGRLSKIPWC